VVARAGASTHQRASGAAPSSACPLGDPSACHEFSSDDHLSDRVGLALLQAIRSSQWRKVSSVITSFNDEAAIPQFVDALQITDAQVRVGARPAAG